MRAFVRTMATASGPEITAPRRELSRHVTPEGRNSLKKHFFHGRNVFGMWANKVVNTATAPLFVCILGGAALATWFGLRHLTTSPDVRIDRMARKQTIRENHAEGKNWVKHRDSMKALPGNAVEKSK